MNHVGGNADMIAKTTKVYPSLNVQCIVLTVKIDIKKYLIFNRRTILVGKTRIKLGKTSPGRARQCRRWAWTKYHVFIGTFIWQEKNFDFLENTFLFESKKIFESYCLDGANQVKLLIQLQWQRDVQMQVATCVSYFEPKRKRSNSESISTIITLRKGKERLSGALFIFVRTHSH